MHTAKMSSCGMHKRCFILVVFLCLDFINCSSIMIDKLRYKRDLSDSYTGNSFDSINQAIDPVREQSNFPSTVYANYRIARKAHVQNYQNCVYNPFLNSWMYIPQEFMLGQGNQLAAFNNAFFNVQNKIQSGFNNQNGFYTGFMPAVSMFPSQTIFGQNPWFANNVNIQNDGQNEYCDQQQGVFPNQAPQIPEEFPYIPETPQIPQQPNLKPQFPEEIPQIPEVPQVPEIFPQIPEEIPQIPEVPQVSENVPQIPEQIPQYPDVPQVPENVPQIPEQIPQYPEEPQIPDNVPQIPEEIPQIPKEIPEVPEKIPEITKDTPQTPEEIPQIPEVIPEVPEKIPTPEQPNEISPPETSINVIPISTEEPLPEVTTPEEFQIDVRFQGSTGGPDKNAPTSESSPSQDAIPFDDSSIAL